MAIVTSSQCLVAAKRFANQTHQMLPKIRCAGVCGGLAAHRISKPVLEAKYHFETLLSNTIKWSK
jgi:hypothetical protein